MKEKHAVSDAQRPARPVPKKISLRKRLAFIVIIVGFLYGLTELLSFLAFWAIDKKPFSFSEDRSKQAALAEGRTDSSDPRVADARRWIGPHPYLGYVNQEGDDYGFANNEIPLIHKRSRDKVIVAVTGGSVAWWFCREGWPTLERKLKEAPSFAGKDVIPVNLAQGGYKQPQQLMALNYFLALGAEFDVFINLDGFNEVALPQWELVPKGIHPCFPSGWYWFFHEHPDPQARCLVGKITYLEERRREWARPFAGAPLSYSVTAQLVWRLRNDSLRKDISASHLALQDHYASGLPVYARGPKASYGSDEELYEEIGSLWKRCSLQADRICRSNGIKYFHFLQPNQYVPGSKPMGDAERKIAYTEKHPYRPGVDKGYPVLLRQGQELVKQGTNFRELTRLFENVTEPLYIDDVGHVNRRGNEILAERIAETILQNP
jgi:hypothetical protein